MGKEYNISPQLEGALKSAYRQFETRTRSNVAVAVRSSATAEDLPDASFAGQQESFLNVSGIDQVLTAIKGVYTSLFNDRAIAYRVHKGFKHTQVAISAGVQQMVRSDLATSGVMFTLDTESGFRDVVLITASYGFGEAIVKGQIEPDEFYVFKPSLKQQKRSILQRRRGTKQNMVVSVSGQGRTTAVDVDKQQQSQFCVNDMEIEQLARIALRVEEHYQRPMDIEWAKDGIDGQFYIVQARPETVQYETKKVIKRFKLKKTSTIIVTGRSIGNRIGSGRARIIKNIKNIDQLQVGEVLVTGMTDPDWEPIMQRAAAIVTDRGGRTCHAAIIARELGVPAIVGTGTATQAIQPNQFITISCAQGDTGYVYEGALDFETQKIALDKMPHVPRKIMMNIGNPERAFSFSQIPNHGIGLARLEFIINNTIGIHPRAIFDLSSLPSEQQRQIRERVAPYDDPKQFYVDKLSNSIATIAAAFYNKPVIVRLSDFKSNEYANLIGGSQFEPKEDNPMLGYRGVSRYLSEMFEPCFALECTAIKKVRNEMGLTNVQVMLPFLRTLHEAEQITLLLKKYGLVRGQDDLKIIMMCEIPANALLAVQFLNYFDGFSIGSNDLTQMTLGMDRDSELISKQFDERDAAVKALIVMAIQACRKAGKYIGICGQAPSDYPDFAKWLVEQGIDSISLDPDSVLDTWTYLANK